MPKAKQLKSFHGLLAKEMIVFELPGEIITAVLSSWIEIEALSKLDSSLCASKLRTQFLGLIRHESFIADTMCTSSLSEDEYVQHFEWLVKRQVKVRNWMVNAEVAKLSPANVRHVAGPHVRSLVLRDLNAEETMQVFSILGVVCSGIQTLRMERCEHWETLNMLGSAAQQSLQELVVVHCESRGCESFPQFPNLRKLRASYLGGANVAVQSMTRLLGAAPGLTDLRLNSLLWCPINDESLEVLSNHASGLEILELDIQPQRFPPAAVVSLTERCSNLKTLVVRCGNEIEDAAVEAFAVHCPRLEGLQMWGRFSDVSLSAVATHCGPRLRYLSLDMMYCDPDGLTAVAEHCRHLEELQLSNCRFTADGLLVQLVSSLPHLRELLLVDSIVASDTALVAIATHLPKLQHLGLLGCGGRYTEAGVVALVTSLTQLQRLCINTGMRWPKVPTGLEIYEDAVATRYFERLCS
jgi:hypothetical protein